jgi:hypothetical protein
VILSEEDFLPDGQVRIMAGDDDGVATEGDATQRRIVAVALQRPQRLEITLRDHLLTP